MEYSSFTEYGLLEFSDVTPTGQRIYEDMVDACGDGFDITPGTYMQAKLYARALAFARANASAERALSANPAIAVDMLPALEKRYRVVPAADATIEQRQAALVLKAQAPTGASTSAVSAALSMLLGPQFLAYMPLPLSMTYPDTLYPSSPTSAGLFGNVKVPPRLYQTIDPIAILGTPITVAYQNYVPGRIKWNGQWPVPPYNLGPIQVGDMLIAGTEKWNQVEVATVTGSNQNHGIDGPFSFTATFTSAHDPGTTLFIGRKPLWTSLKRFNLVIVKSSAALSASTRNQIHLLMQAHVRGTSQWAIVQPTRPGDNTTGPFSVGTPIGITTIGSVTFA